MTNLEVERFRLGILQQAWGNGKGAIKTNLGRVLFEDAYFQILLRDAITSQVLGVMKQGWIKSEGFLHCLGVCSALNWSPPCSPHHLVEILVMVDK